MRSITFENKELHFDFTLGAINDVFVKELGGNFDDLINFQDMADNPSKLLEVTRDILLSGHIYYLFINGQEEEGDKLLGKLRSARMIASKWLMEVKPITVIEWVTKDMMPSDMGQPSEGGEVGGK